MANYRVTVLGHFASGRTWSFRTLDETLAVAGLIGSTPSTRISTAIGALFGAMRSAGNAFFVYNVKTSVHDPLLFTPKTIVSQETDRVVRTLRVRVRKSRAQYV